MEIKEINREEKTGGKHLFVCFAPVNSGDDEVKRERNVPLQILCDSVTA